MGLRTLLDKFQNLQDAIKELPPARLPNQLPI
jgi:hypothetical protein